MHNYDSVQRRLSCLLVGPYDPTCGEYTFLSPPLGVWRLAGSLEQEDVFADVFDPNCVEGNVATAFDMVLRGRAWDIIGFSTTGMTLQYDLSLAHAAKRACPTAVLIAGGMEATFRPDKVLRLGPFALVVLGEGERPLAEVARRLRQDAGLTGIPGTAMASPGNTVDRYSQTALTHTELAVSIFGTPYERMPYRAYWSKLERAYKVGGLPVKAERECRLADIRSVRLITLNYCPMGCTFCASTNFLNEAQGATAPIARLDADECLQMVRKLLTAFPDVRTVIFQDDIFVFRADSRVGPLCEAILAAKRAGVIPGDLRFISTNRIDAMTPERLALMRSAGFGVLGFGVESFSPNVLREFNKSQIVSYIEPILTAALSLGITPFLDLILTSPGSRLQDLATTVTEAYRWTLAGCETGMYPYVIPFSGSALARGADGAPNAETVRRSVRGTDIEWSEAGKLLPLDAETRDAILCIETIYLRRLDVLETRVAHLPSRLRSLLWIISAIPVLTKRGVSMPDESAAVEYCLSRLPWIDPGSDCAVDAAAALAC